MLAAALFMLMPMEPIDPASSQGVQMTCDLGFEAIQQQIKESNAVADEVLIRKTQPLRDQNISYLLTDETHIAHPAIYKVVTLDHKSEVTIHSYACVYGDKAAGKTLMEQISLLMDYNGKVLIEEKGLSAGPPPFEAVPKIPSNAFPKIEPSQITTQTKENGTR